MKYFRLLTLGTLALVAVTTLKPDQSLGKPDTGHSNAGGSLETSEGTYRPGKEAAQIPASVTQQQKDSLPPPVPIVIDDLGLTQAQQSEPTMPPEPSILPKPIAPTNGQPNPIDPLVLKPNCPRTIVLNVGSGAPATPNPTDFPPPPPSPITLSPNFGFSTPNTHLRHTFSFPGPCRERNCCEIQRAVLQLQVKALQGGQNQQSSNAGNDKWYIYKNGTVLASGFIWSSFPVTPGQTQTLTIPIQPAWLNGCRLSFLTQDDTSVIAAKLTVIGCCVRPNMSTTGS